MKIYQCDNCDSIIYNNQKLFNFVLHQSYNKEEITTFFPRHLCENCYNAIIEALEKLQKK